VRHNLCVKRALCVLVLVFAATGCGKPPPTQTVTELTGFTNAEGNIGCYIDVDSVRCDVAEPGWTLPPKPADCTLEYGRGIELAEGAEAQFVCAGDSTLNSGSPLPLGQAIKAGTITCENKLERFTCLDSKGGHGFMISSGTYKLY
jgi:hypothetical protein